MIILMCINQTHVAYRLRIISDSDFFSNNAQLEITTSAINETSEEPTVEKKWFKIKDYIPQKENNPCEFLPWSPSSPLPLILISRGRSGSSVIWDAIGNILGQSSDLYEMTGGNTTKSRIFFDKKIPPHVGKNWPIVAQCNAQHLYSQSSISGFQWKPFRATFNHTLSEGGLEALAKYQSSHNAHDLPIKVIFNHRNKLDRLVSNKKHADRDATTAHCAVGDEECIQTHKALAKKGIEVSLDNLLQDLEEDDQNRREIQEKLDEYNVDHIFVKYEKLFNTEDAGEWKRLFRYLGRGPVEGLTMDDIRNSLSFASTVTSRAETISNYQSVKDYLTGTKFEYLLHD